MSDSKIRVGIVGLNATRGWGGMVHVPALRGLPDYEVTAVANTRLESAQDAARRFGIPHAFGDARQLIEHPDVDLVSVCVKVSGHYELVMAALEAGKHVYCEWPLGHTLDQAIAMRDLANRAGVRHMVGLQSRGSPAVCHARDLVAQGYVGRILSCSMLSVVPQWGLAMDTPNAYTLDRRNRANILTVATGHSLDLLCSIAGDFSELSATLAVRRTRARLTDSGAEIDVTSPDQVALHGCLDNGAVVSAHIQGGAPHATKFLLEINGEEGSLVLSDRGPLSVQMAPLALMGARGSTASLAEIAVPDRCRWVPSEVPAGPPFNVAQLYARLARSIRDGNPAEPDFSTGVRCHQWIEAIEHSAASGQRQRLESPVLTTA